MTRQERATQLVARFPKIYPHAHCELDFSNALELLVATILSAQCTDKRVNLVTPILFRRCRTATDFAQIDPEELEEIIRSAGFFRAKARSLRAMGAELVAKFQGEVPSNMEALRALPGVGRKTANVVLGNAFGIDEGIVVDTHVSRLSHRLKLTTHSDPEKIEKDLVRIIPRVDWTLWSHWLIFHGRRRCFARSPDCPGCEIKDICPTAFRHGPPEQKKRSTPSGNPAKLDGKSTRRPAPVPLP